jgi:site-specific recombinase XerC
VLIVLLMVQEGLRCAEVSPLQVGDVDFEGLPVRVIGKGGHHRLLPISDETRLALLTYFGAVPATRRGGAAPGMACTVALYPRAMARSGRWGV